MHKVHLVFIVLGIFFFFSCNSFKSNSQNTDTTIHQIVAEPVAPGSFNAASGIRFDSNAIRKFLNDKPLFREFRKDFDTFYRNNNYDYAWYDKNGLIETSSALISSLENVEQEGVTANIPYKDSLDQLLHNADTTNIIKPDINTELMLTGEYFYYAKKIWAGALNNKADSINWYLPRKKASYAALLADNLSTGKLAELQGEIAKLQYDGLKNALAFYRDVDKKGEEIVVPSLSKPGTLKPGGSSSSVPLIRKRLMQLGDINEADSSTVYDAKLADAVNHAKKRYGLKPDSVITNSLINEINVPAKKRSEQLMVNMERLRWMPVDTSNSGEFILVNIPDYMLHYFENKKDVWSCNVVVGTPMTKTVIFSGKMQYVVFSPYWNVPPSIINKEVKPGMRRNPNYLAAHNMEWNGGSVRQKPGPSNSLGLIKFLFPNSNNIYLHDTPSKSLFERESRAFSHGCIRVSKPRDLAIRVLRRNPEWTPDKIDAAMHAGKEKYVTLNKTIPVYIGYFTAFLDADNQLSFRTDVYKRDGSLLQMLMQN
jgi:murein L,D-transpeptidase YcbB/YkuD